MNTTVPQDGNGTPAGASPSRGSSPALPPDESRLLSEAIARGDKDVLLLIAVAPGKSGRLVSEIESLGGTIRSHHEDLGYISARVPVDKVEAVAQLQGVEAVNLDEEIPIPDPKP